jgi:hypothetical protein
VIVTIWWWKKLVRDWHDCTDFTCGRFNLKKLNEVEGKEQYQVEISKRFAALENSDADLDTNNALETIRDIKISATKNLGYYELKRVIKPIMSIETLKIVYSSYFHSLMIRNYFLG